MAGYAQLPGYAVPNALNFDGLNQGIDAASKGIAQGRMNALNMDIGQRAAAGDWSGAANTAFGAGQIDTGMGIASYKQKSDMAEDDRMEKFKTHSAGIAQAILADKDPARAQAQWQRLIASDPRWQKTLSQYGVDPNDYKAGAGLVVSSVRGYRDPIEEQLKRSQLATSDLTRQGLGLDLQIKRRDLESPAQKFQVVPEGSTVLRENPRAGEATVVYQGKPKQDALTKKEIIEADQGVQSGRSALSQLSRALELSNEAYSGWGADARAAVVDSVAPWSTPQASATVQMKQIVASQALEALKATFGGAPTEGERKILIEIQGSANQSRATREDIFKRAQQLIKSRIEYNTQVSNGLRSGNYFQPDGAPQMAAPQSATPGAQPQSAPVQLNGKTYVKNSTGQWVEQ